MLMIINQNIKYTKNRPSYRDLFHKDNFFKPNDKLAFKSFFVKKALYFLPELDV